MGTAGGGSGGKWDVSARKLRRLLPKLASKRKRRQAAAKGFKVQDVIKKLGKPVEGYVWREKKVKTKQMR